MEPSKIDRASVSNALRKMPEFRSDMLCKPFHVGAGSRHNANHSGPIMTVVKNGFSMVSGACLVSQDPELSDIFADEKKHGLK